MRNYETEAIDIEGKKYSYEFDARIRRFAMRVFEPYFREDDALELGCHKGDFTSLLQPRFKDLVVIEPSESMINEAGDRIAGKAQFIQSTIEACELDEDFSNIFLINVLEHTDDPVVVLKKVNDLLTPTGLFFLLVPNAHAPSRQIAVNMGIVTHTEGWTEGEYFHGHRRTYTLESLEKDVRASDLEIVQKGGIFFKAFGNYQYDEALERGIINDEYMEGAFQLGFKYPELCASIYMICRRK